MAKRVPEIIDLEAETIAVAAEETPVLELDPFFPVLVRRVGVPVARSFTPQQFEALKRAFGERQSVLRPIGAAGLFSVLRPRLAFVPIPGRSRRAQTAWRRRQEAAGLRGVLEVGLNIAIFGALLWGAVATFMALGIQ